MKRPLLLLPWLVLKATAADDLTALSDEFRSPDTAIQWKRIFQTEGWDNDALQTFDLGGNGSGKLRLIPHSSTWFQEWRGELTYKEITVTWEQQTSSWKATVPLNPLSARFIRVAELP